MLTTLKNLPKSPGVYQYFDKNDRLLYVGKAKNLFNRVRSYFNFTPSLKPHSKLSHRIRLMIEDATSINYIVLDSEHDALILENSLIKQLQPKYNILLRDDKTYPYITINLDEPFARFEITRKVIKNPKQLYFGPFSGGARDILDSLYDLFALVQKKGCESGKKACLYHQLKKCHAPCEGKIGPKKYRQIIDEAIIHIQDKKKLTNKLTEKMSEYALNMRYEEAATLRDRITSITKSIINTPIDLATDEDADIFAIESTEKEAMIVRLFMRNGRIVSSSHEQIRFKIDFDKDESYRRAILDFYTLKVPLMVKQILVADSFEDSKLLEDILKKEFSQNVDITFPLRGPKAKLVQLAQKNAIELLSQNSKKEQTDVSFKLQELCSLEREPRRIEVFDNSHNLGQASVGGMIVFDNNKFDKSSYRRYSLDSQDEYSQMKETLTRRIMRFDEINPPDLWVIDGGLTLLKLANELLLSSGTYIDTIAISKEKIDAKSKRAKGSTRDIIYTKDEIFRLNTNDVRLQWVQRLRDEAHRYAISYHRKLKLKEDKEQTKLSTINGIGSAKIKKLISYFGTYDAIYNASVNELSNVISEKDAKNIYNIKYKK